MNYERETKQLFMKENIDLHGSWESVCVSMSKVTTGEITNGELEFVATRGTHFSDDLQVDDVELISNDCPRKFVCSKQIKCLGSVYKSLLTSIVLYLMDRVLKDLHFWKNIYYIAYFHISDFASCDFNSSLFCRYKRTSESGFSWAWGTYKLAGRYIPAPTTDHTQGTSDGKF